jgi:hypothetical protein
MQRQGNDRSVVASGLSAVARVRSPVRALVGVRG